LVQEVVSFYSNYDNWLNIRMDKSDGQFHSLIGGAMAV